MAKGDDEKPRGVASPPKPPVLLDVPTEACEDSLEFLRAVVKDQKAPAELRVRAAVCLAQYEHTRSKDGGKNIRKSKESREAAKGKFAPGEAPRLAVDNTK